MATTSLTQSFESKPFNQNQHAAYSLKNEERAQLSIQVLSRTEPVSELAKRHQVSRKFLYQQADKASEAIQEAFKSQSKDEEVIFYLPVTKAWLKQVVLGLILLCHSFFRGVVEFFRDLFALPLSVGTVHNIVEEAIPQAQKINALYDLSPIRVGSHDELFQGKLPVLGGIDLDSTYCYLLAGEAQRDAETWGVHLLNLAGQGLNPDYTVADGGRGLRAGQALAWPDVPCFGDVFHGLQELTRLRNTLEKRAYGFISKRESLEQKMDKAKGQGKGRSLSKKLGQVRKQEATAIGLFDSLCILTNWMQKDILSLAGPDADTRIELYNFVIAEMKKLEQQDAKRIRPVWRFLDNQRDDLLAFAKKLDQDLVGIAQCFGVPVFLVQHMLELQGMGSSKEAYWELEKKLRSQLHSQFYFIQEAVIEVMQKSHRSSSMIENLNSRLRSYFFLRRQIGPRYLDLLRFFLNHRPFLRSELPERVGKTPAELMTGKEHAHWLELLGFTPFRRLAD